MAIHKDDQLIIHIWQVNFIIIVHICILRNCKTPPPPLSLSLSCARMCTK